MAYGGNQDRGYQGRPKAPTAAPKPFTLEGFYTGDKHIKPDLFDNTARKIAESFYTENPQNGVITGVSITQLRRLFDEVKRFEQILEVTPEQWEEQLPYIKMIKSKVHYAVARAIKQKGEEEGVYKNLAAFITQGIDMVKELPDYHVFVSLFEATYGFYYEKAPNEKASKSTGYGKGRYEA